MRESQIYFNVVFFFSRIFFDFVSELSAIVKRIWGRFL